MILPNFSCFFICLGLLLSGSLASIPASYPFDKPTFGSTRCDDSLPDKPPLNPQLREDARNKLAQMGSVNPNRISPLLALNLFRAINIDGTTPSSGRPANGESPTMLFQYWEPPLLYQVYASQRTTNLVDKGGDSIKTMIATAVYDVLSTCCQYGNAGVQFVQTSDDRHAYIEVTVSHSPNQPSDNPFEATGPSELEMDPTPRRGSNPWIPLRTSSGGAELSRPKPFPDSPDRSTVPMEDEGGATPHGDDLLSTAMSQLSGIPPDHVAGNSTQGGFNTQGNSSAQGAGGEFAVNIAALEPLARRIQQMPVEQQSYLRGFQDALLATGFCVPTNRQSMSRVSGQEQQQNRQQDIQHRQQDANMCIRCITWPARAACRIPIDETCFQAMSRRGEEMQSCLHYCVGISVPFGVCVTIGALFTTIYIAYKQ